MIALRTVPVTCQAQKSIVFCRAHWSFGCPVPVPTSGGRRLVTVALNAVAACTDRPRWRVCACDCAWPAVPVSLVSLALISLGFACARCGNCRGAGAGTTLPGEACPFRRCRCRYRDPSPPDWNGVADPPPHPTRALSAGSAVPSAAGGVSFSGSAKLDLPDRRKIDGAKAPRPAERRKTIRHPHVCSPRTPWPLATGQIDSLGRTH